MAVRALLVIVSLVSAAAMASVFGGTTAPASTAGMCGEDMSCEVSSLTSDGTVTSNAASGTCAYVLGNGARICRGDGSVSRIQANAAGDWEVYGQLKPANGINMNGSGLFDGFSGAVRVNSISGFGIAPMTAASLPTCHSASSATTSPPRSSEAVRFTIVGTGGAYTKTCECRYDGTTRKWFNVDAPDVTTGTATTCPDVPAGRVLRGYKGTTTIDFAAISPSSASAPGVIPVAGAQVGALAQCSATAQLSSALLLSQWVSAAGEVSITLYNPSSVDSVDLPATEFSCVVFSSP